MPKKHILLVEDEEDIRELIIYNLEKEGYSITACEDGDSVDRQIAARIPDVILLDLMLPGTNGMDICKNLKQDRSTRRIPIIMVTAKTEDTDVITGLEVGADDYISKPFSPKVLIARIRSVLRRADSDDGRSGLNIIKYGSITIDVSKHEVTMDGEILQLSATEFGVLQLLAGNPGWVYSRGQIISAVKGDDYPVTERAVDVQILGLRKKLGDAGDCIETVRGVGYRLRSRSTY
jgi:two-component system, OmpR family, alkaline phosphatase synthesis response regulator PhoP